MTDLIANKCSTILTEAVHTLLETGILQPAIFFGKGDDLQQVDLTMPDSPFEKMKMVEKLRNHAAEMSADYVIFISDCWTSKQLESQPSLDPKRKEAILMNCQFGDISFITMQEYTRTDDNQIILGERITDHADGGIFASILPKTAQNAEANV